MHQAVEDFIGSSVASYGDDYVEGGAGGVLGQLDGVPGIICRENFEIQAQLAQALLDERTGFLPTPPARDRIEDDFIAGHYASGSHFTCR